MVKAKIVILSDVILNVCGVNIYLRQLEDKEIQREAQGMPTYKTMTPKDLCYVYVM